MKHHINWILVAALATGAANDTSAKQCIVDGKPMTCIIRDGKVVGIRP